MEARLAQSVERKALNLVVVGSSPTVGASLFPTSHSFCSTSSTPPISPVFFPQHTLHNIPTCIHPNFCYLVHAIGTWWTLNLLPIGLGVPLICDWAPPPCPLQTSAQLHLHCCHMQLGSPTEFNTRQRTSSLDNESYLSTWWTGCTQDWRCTLSHGSTSCMLSWVNCVVVLGCRKPVRATLVVLSQATLDLPWHTMTPT